LKTKEIQEVLKKAGAVVVKANVSVEAAAVGKMCDQSPMSPSFLYTMVILMKNSNY
jgi:hypothetical protein